VEETPSTAPRGLREALAALLPALAALAEVEPDREVCGFVLRDAERGFTVLPARNSASDPARRFEVDPRDLFAVHRRSREGGPAVAAVYHSHPRGGGGALSAADRAALLLEDGGPLLPGVALIVVGMGGERAEEVRVHCWATPGAFGELVRATRIRTAGEDESWTISPNVP
jgi:proteasome lid subunit RPN8/RPN11